MGIFENVEGWLACHGLICFGLDFLTPLAVPLPPMRPQQQQSNFKQDRFGTINVGETLWRWKPYVWIWLVRQFKRKNWFVWIHNLEFAIKWRFWKWRWNNDVSRADRTSPWTWKLLPHVTPENASLICINSIPQKVFVQTESNCISMNSTPFVPYVPNVLNVMRRWGVVTARKKSWSELQLFKNSFL